jgi:GT2 family glycosyltransferase
VDDIAIITVSTSEAHWLRPCLSTVFAHMGDVSADVVVVDNESRDGTADVVATEFPDARVVPSRNHGFSHANNRGLMTCDARYVLFLNPDTESRQDDPPLSECRARAGRRRRGGATAATSTLVRRT